MGFTGKLLRRSSCQPGEDAPTRSHETPIKHVLEPQTRTDISLYHLHREDRGCANKRHTHTHTHTRTHTHTHTHTHTLTHTHIHTHTNTYTHTHTLTHTHTHTHTHLLALRRIMALRQTYSSLRSLSSLTLDVAAISMSKISERPWTQFPSSLPCKDTETALNLRLFWGKLGGHPVTSCRYALVFDSHRDPKDGNEAVRV